MKGLAEQLREKGLKVTPQRMAIYEMLCNTTAHPTAEQVWESIKETFPAVSFNTVYTTLSAFEQCGLVQRLHIGDNVAHYDANIEPHIHITCKSCDRVEDYHGPSGVNIKHLMHILSNEMKYSVDRMELNAFGQCSCCREEK